MGNRVRLIPVSCFLLYKLMMIWSCVRNCSLKELWCEHELNHDCSFSPGNLRRMIQDSFDSLLNEMETWKCQYMKGKIKLNAFCFCFSCSCWKWLQFPRMRSFLKKEEEVSCVHFWKIPFVGGDECKTILFLDK